ncbi:hypothetical protein EV182_004966, partial [Spiromyces aspiralis]
MDELYKVRERLNRERLKAVNEEMKREIRTLGYEPATVHHDSGDEGVEVATSSARKGSDGSEDLSDDVSNVSAARPPLIQPVVPIDDYAGSRSPPLRGNGGARDGLIGIEPPLANKSAVVTSVSAGRQSSVAETGQPVCIVPKPGFAIQTRVAQSRHDAQPATVVETGEGKSSRRKQARKGDGERRQRPQQQSELAADTLVYINICSHSRIPRPPGNVPEEEIQKALRADPTAKWQVPIYLSDPVKGTTRA